MNQLKVRSRPQLQLELLVQLQLHLLVREPLVVSCLCSGSRTLTQRRTLGVVVGCSTRPTGLFLLENRSILRWFRTCQGRNRMKERMLMLSPEELRELEMYLNFCGLNANWKWPGKELEVVREKIGLEVKRLSREEAQNAESVWRDLRKGEKSTRTPWSEGGEAT